MSLLTDYEQTLRLMTADALKSEILTRYRLYFRKSYRDRQHDQHVLVCFRVCTERGMTETADAMLLKAKKEIEDERLQQAAALAEMRERVERKDTES